MVPNFLMRNYHFNQFDICTVFFNTKSVPLINIVPSILDFFSKTF